MINSHYINTCVSIILFGTNYDVTYGEREVRVARGHVTLDTVTAVVSKIMFSYSHFLVKIIS